MSMLIRGVVVAAGIAGAFIGGYSFNPSPVRSLPSLAAAERPTVVVPTPAKEAAAVPSRRENLKLANFPEAKEADHAAPEFLPPVGPPTDPKDIPVDQKDLALKMIAEELGIKTLSVVEGPVPVPEVLLPKVKRPEEVATPVLVPPSFPSMATTRLLSDRSVSLDFQVAKAGPAKVKAVEVWAKRDAGKWEMLDRRPGGELPIRTHLAGDGVYGLKLVIESESGMRTPAPTESSVPELVAELDTTPPQVELLVPESAGGAVGKVLIRWGMADRNLDPAATRLEYSIDGTTWLPIVCSKNALIPRVDARSTGLQKYSQEWILPPNVPHQVHIRVTARDKAGNEASDELPKKLSVDLVVPEGRLTGISSQGGRIEKAPAPRIVQVAGDTAGGI